VTERLSTIEIDEDLAQAIGAYAVGDLSKNRSLNRIRIDDTPPIRREHVTIGDALL
jgi:hypothetical protein